VDLDKTEESSAQIHRKTFLREILGQTEPFERNRQLSIGFFVRKISAKKCKAFIGLTINQINQIKFIIQQRANQPLTS